MIISTTTTMERAAATRSETPVPLPIPNPDPSPPDPGPTPVTPPPEPGGRRHQVRPRTARAVRSSRRSHLVVRDADHVTARTSPFHASTIAGAT